MITHSWIPENTIWVATALTMRPVILTIGPVAFTRSRLCPIYSDESMMMKFMSRARDRHTMVRMNPWRVMNSKWLP